MTPKFIGKRHLVNIDLAQIAQHIDWRQYLSTLGINGRNRDTPYGLEALAEGQAYLKKILRKRTVKAHAAVGFYPATPTEKAVAVHAAGAEFTWHCGKQAARHDSKKPRSWADHVSDHIGLFTCSVDATHEKTDDLYQQILIANIADCLVEATAAWLHARVRDEWWQGHCRPAPGYPSCPDYSVLADIQRALDTARIGVTQPDKYALAPHSTISGFLIGDKKATYFGGVV